MLVLTYCWLAPTQVLELPIAHYQEGSYWKESPAPTSINQESIVGRGVADTNGSSVGHTGVGDIDTSVARRRSRTASSASAGAGASTRSRSTTSVVVPGSLLSTAVVVMVVMLAMVPTELTHAERAMGVDRLQDLLSPCSVAGDDVFAMKCG